MPRLFSYTIPIDDGAAPNPFHGMCSLVICKPAIRRVAERGDWIAALGSRNATSGDLSGCLCDYLIAGVGLPRKRPFRTRQSCGQERGRAPQTVVCFNNVHGRTAIEYSGVRPASGSQ
jgi:hypothetical protein